MQRVCFTLQVRIDKLDEYKRRHQAVWPEMQQALRENGWSNYSLFLREDGLLIGYLQTEDFITAKQKMAATEVNAKWQRQMAEFFVTPDLLTAGSGPEPLTEVFHLE